MSEAIKPYLEHVCGAGDLAGCGQQQQCFLAVEIEVRVWQNRLPDRGVRSTRIIGKVVHGFRFRQRMRASRASCSRAAKVDQTEAVNERLIHRAQLTTERAAAIRSVGLNHSELLPGRSALEFRNCPAGSCSIWMKRSGRECRHGFKVKPGTSSPTFTCSMLTTITAEYF